MKKIIFITLTVLYFAQAKSQTDLDNREKLQVGIRAGLNYSNVYDESGEKFNTDPKLGLAAGAFLEIPFGKYLGIQPEVLISQKGFKGAGVLMGNTYDMTRTTTYLDIPLQFAFKPSEFITLVGGPQFSYLLKQSDVFKSTTYSYLQEQEFKQQSIRKNLLSAVVGLNINIGHFAIGARAGWDLQNNHGDGTSSAPRYKNVWYQATLGYKLFKNS